MPKYNNKKQHKMINWGDSKRMPIDDPYNKKYKINKKSSGKSDYHKRFYYLCDKNAINTRSMEKVGYIYINTRDNTPKTDGIIFYNNKSNKYHRCDGTTTNEVGICEKCLQTLDKKKKISEVLNTYTGQIEEIDYKEKKLKEGYEKMLPEEYQSMKLKKSSLQSNLLSTLKLLDDKYKPIDKWIKMKDLKEMTNYCPLIIPSLILSQLKLTISSSIIDIKKNSGINDRCYLKLTIEVIKMKEKDYRQFKVEYIKKIAEDNTNQSRIDKITREKLGNKNCTSQINCKKPENLFDRLNILNRDNGDINKNLINRNEILDVKFNAIKLMGEEVDVKNNTTFNTTIYSDKMKVTLSSGEIIVVLVSCCGNDHVIIPNMKVRLSAVNSYDNTFRPDMIII